MRSGMRYSQDGVCIEQELFEGSLEGKNVLSIIPMYVR